MIFQRADAIRKHNGITRMGTRRKNNRNNVVLRYIGITTIKQKIEWALNFANGDRKKGNETKKLPQIFAVLRRCDEKRRRDREIMGISLPEMGMLRRVAQSLRRSSFIF